MGKKKIELTPSQIIPLLEDTIRNNKRLCDLNIETVTVGIEGLPGIAKTQICKQVAQKFPEHYYHQENIAEKEPGDILGFPYVSFETEKDHEVKWIPEKTLTHFMALGYMPTGNTRMDYALPKWLTAAGDKPLILVLDDFSRCSNVMANATMQLIQNQSFGSWSLPKGSTIFLTTNPSDGQDSFMVLALDDAQSSRFIKLNCIASVADWALWAVGKVDQRAIDFLLHQREVIEGTDKKANGEVLKKGNLRSWTIFFNAISYYSDFGSNWESIDNLGSGSFPEEHMILFHNFIKEKLDKLPSPKEILETKDLPGTIKQLQKLTEKRQDIVALLTKRLYNYLVVNKDSLKENHMLAYRTIIEDETICSKDIVLQNVKSLRGEIPELFKFLFKSKVVMKSLMTQTT